MAGAWAYSMQRIVFVSGITCSSGHERGIDTSRLLSLDELSLAALDILW